MNIIQRTGKNMLALGTSYFAIAILSLLQSIFIARFLGDIALGMFYLAITIPTFFMILMDLGYETFLLREVARNKSLAGKYLSKIFTFRLLLIPIIISLLIFTVNILAYSESTKHLIYLLIFYYILSSLSALIRVTFRAFQKMEYEAFINIFMSFFRIVLTLILLYIGYGLIEITFIFILSGSIELLISYLVCRKKFVKIRLEIDFSFIKNSIKIALPMTFIAFFSIIFVKIDTLMLSYMKGDAVVGWYNAAYSLTLSFNPIPHITMTALLPILSIYYISSKTSLKAAYEKSFKYLFYLALPLAIGIFMLADNLIILLYGAEFTESIPALKILTWDILIKFLYLCSSYVLISTDQQKQMTIVVIFTAVLNIILNLVLIPSYSYIGSGIATLISEFFLLISYLYINSHNSFTIDIKKFFIQPIVACGGMVLFLYNFPTLQLILKIILAMLIYFTILILIKGFSKEDFQLFKQLIKKREN